MAGMAAPGWYPDGQALGVLRGWDGTRWTGITQSAHPATPACGSGVPTSGPMTGRGPVGMAAAVQDDVGMPGRKKVIDRASRQPDMN